MKILFLVPHPPDEAPGQRLKFEQYYERFRAAGHEVVHDAFYTSAFYRRLGQPGLPGKLVGLAGACLQRICSLWRAWRSDLVYLFLEAMPAGPPFIEWILTRVLRKPVIYDIDDLIYLKKPGSRDPFSTLFDRRRKVEFLMRNARHVIAGTTHLEKFARAVSSHVTRIPPTIDTLKYRPRLKCASARIRLGWSGSFSTSPYLHLLDDVLRTLQKSRGVTVRVIGDPRFSIPGVELEALPWRLQTEVEDLSEIDIGLYPLPHEEWVLGKGGGKALQYMGLAIPTVLTPIGANLEIVQHGVNGLFADDTSEWIDALTQLIEEPSLRERIGQAGRKTVEERYSVERNWPLYRAAVEGSFGTDPAQGIDVLPLPE